MLGFLLLPASAFAQASEGSIFERATTQDLLLFFVLALMLFVTIVVLIVAVYTLNILNLIINKDRVKKGIAPAEETKKVNWWQRFDRTVTDAVPLEREETILLDHNYDGIRELDNHLPPWWKWLFYFTIGWAVVYLIVYHVTGTLPLQETEYNMELAEAAEAAQARMVANVETIDESSVAFNDDPAILNNGQIIYKRNCAVCHQEDGGGLVGPNLTDEYWLHGGSMQDIFKVVKYGVPQKGMIAWQSQLSPSDMRDVSSYIMTLQGTTPANPKEPQGEKYVPEEKEETEESEEDQSIAQNN